MTSMVLTMLLAALGAAGPATGRQHDHQMDKRGHQAMGFDQAAATHHFRLKKSGGAIEITARDSSDDPLIGRIRAHLEHIRGAFAAGDFAMPMFIHATEPPGVAVLKERHTRLEFGYQEIPNGGRLEITTSDAEALAALHAFLTFQIREHRTGDPLTPRIPEQ